MVERSVRRGPGWRPLRIAASAVLAFGTGLVLAALALSTTLMRDAALGLAMLGLPTAAIGAMLWWIDAADGRGRGGERSHRRRSGSSRHHRGDVKATRFAHSTMFDSRAMSPDSEWSRSRAGPVTAAALDWDTPGSRHAGGSSPPVVRTAPGPWGERATVPPLPPAPPPVLPMPGGNALLRTAHGAGTNGQTPAVTAPVVSGNADGHDLAAAVDRAAPAAASRPPAATPAVPAAPAQGSLPTAPARSADVLPMLRDAVGSATATATATAAAAAAAATAPATGDAAGMKVRALASAMGAPARATDDWARAAAADPSVRDAQTRRAAPAEERTAAAATPAAASVTPLHGASPAVPVTPVIPITSALTAPANVAAAAAAAAGRSPAPAVAQPSPAPAAVSPAAVGGGTAALLLAALHDPVLFEAIVQALYRQVGFRVRVQPHASGQGGMHLWLYSRHHRGPALSVVRCERDRGVVADTPLLRALAAVMSAHGARRGHFVSPAGFTQDARSYAYRHAIHLLDRPALQSLIQARSPLHQQQLLQAVQGTADQDGDAKAAHGHRSPPQGHPGHHAVAQAQRIHGR